MTYFSDTEYEWLEYTNNTWLSVSEPVLTVLNNLYNSTKQSALSNASSGEEQYHTDASYEFIGMNVTIDNSIQRGIMNCRINNRHTQIRF